MPKVSKWRQFAAPIIAEIIANNPGMNAKDLRKLINESYPFAYPSGHPRKMWQKEVSLQLGIKKVKINLQLKKRCLMESNFWKTLMLEIGRKCPNVRVFRNNIGLGWVGKIAKQSPGQVVINNPRPLHAGLIAGSGDGIGYTTIVITPEMVGKKVAVFTSIETKSKTGKAKDAQIVWAKNVQDAGGIALVIKEGQTLDLELLKNYKP